MPERQKRKHKRQYPPKPVGGDPTLSGEEMILKCLLDPANRKSKRQGHEGGQYAYQIERYIKINFSAHPSAEKVDEWLPLILPVMVSEGKVINVNAALPNTKAVYKVPDEFAEKLFRMRFAKDPGLIHLRWATPYAKVAARKKRKAVSGVRSPSREPVKSLSVRRKFNELVGKRRHAVSNERRTRRRSKVQKARAETARALRGV
eukprot:NODE_3963_length_888_cov_24.209774_g3651_i0.p1 GENE.NODE_3963_length_888_cov_24.209774_g3651_i0~~NODE_3963_length_888_cov_24.209774_g3651_i0.p1  ORF type:complete len:232 (-),score=57.88 NODE_3963_length_888_cov_24.209774_g3651_i0:191-802(-)